jgi:hypothetical protein
MLRGRRLAALGAHGSVIALLWLFACTSSRSLATGASDASLDGAVPEDAGPDAADALPTMQEDSFGPEPDALPPFSDPYGGASGCDGGFDGGEACGAEALLHGGLNELFRGQGCGGISRTILAESTTLALLITFSSELVPGEVGAELPAMVQIATFGDGADAGQLVWITPEGACTIVFTSNVCLPNTPGTYGISGTGTCAQAAVAQPGTPASPVSIPSFSFSSYWVAPSSGDE